MVHDDIHVLILYRGISGLTDLYRRDDLLVQCFQIHGKCKGTDSGHGRNFLLNIKLIPARPVRNFLFGDPGLLIFVPGRHAHRLLS